MDTPLSPGDLLFSIVFSAVCKSCSVAFAMVAVLLRKCSSHYVQKFCLFMRFSVLCHIEVFVECVS